MEGFKVIRIPTKFSRGISRMSKEEKSDLLDMLIDIGNGKEITPPDSILGDTIELIYGDWMNMEKKNGVKVEDSLIKYPSEGVGREDASDSDSIVKDSIVQYSIVKDSKVKDNSKELQNQDSEEAPTYGNEEVNKMLKFLCTTVGVDQFKESQVTQRRRTKNIIDFTKKHGKEDLIERLKGVLSDDFTAKRCNSIKVLYEEIKSYRHSPIEMKEEPKITVI